MRKMNILVNTRDEFSDFDHGLVTNAGKVEIYQFLEKCLMDFDKNQI